MKRLSPLFSPTPPTSQYLWHVCRTEKLDTFLKGGLWLARIDQFNDDREASIPEQNRRHLLAKHPIKECVWIENAYNYSAKRTYVSCWTMGGKNCPAHAWEVFGDDEDRVAIRTTAKALVGSLGGLPVNEKGPAYLSEVRYIEHDTDVVPEYNTLETCIVVQTLFSPEQEARLLVLSDGTSAADTLAGIWGPFGPVLVKAKSGGMEGGHLGGRAMVLPIQPKNLIQYIEIDRKMPLIKTAQILAKLSLAGLICRTRFR